jgi:hypothetical protein
MSTAAIERMILRLGRLMIACDDFGLRMYLSWRIKHYARRLGR